MISTRLKYIYIYITYHPITKESRSVTGIAARAAGVSAKNSSIAGMKVETDRFLLQDLCGSDLRKKFALCGLAIGYTLVYFLDYPIW